MPDWGMLASCKILDFDVFCCSVSLESSRFQRCEKKKKKVELPFFFSLYRISFILIFDGYFIDFGPITKLKQLHLHPHQNDNVCTTRLYLSADTVAFFI